MTLTKKQERWLQWFAVHGGHGYVDRYGRIIVGGEQSYIASSVCFLHLVAKGYIKGSGGWLTLTKTGFAWAKENC